MEKKFKNTALPKQAHAQTLLVIIFSGIVVLVAGLSIMGHLAAKRKEAEAKQDSSDQIK